MPSGPLQRYRELVTSRGLEPDPAQLAAATLLDNLALELRRWRPGGNGLLSLLRSGSSWPPRGLYIYGAIGTGKTVLMDLFFDCVRFASRRRIHFHEFMAETHDLIAIARNNANGDPVRAVARQHAARARLLCFDELHVTDIADAMILGRLFRGLFEAGVVMVATSNTKPADLYQGGLNRQLFLPFIANIEQHMMLFELKAAKDFRLDKLAGRKLYFAPADATAHAEMRAAFARLTGRSSGMPQELVVKGHKVQVPEAAMGVARFTFADLCEKPLGARDYLHIAHAFHTVLIESIPRLSPARRNEARRFVNLIDTLYDNGVCLVASAEAEPHELYPEGDGANLFQRTASRLIEMRSEPYLQARLQRAATSAAGH